MLHRGAGEEPVGMGEMDHPKPKFVARPVPSRIGKTSLRSLAIRLREPDPAQLRLLLAPLLNKRSVRDHDAILFAHRETDL